MSKPCLCRCGRDANREFLPGHDLRVATRLLPGMTATAAAAALVREHGSIAEALRVLGAPALGGQR